MQFQCDRKLLVDALSKIEQIIPARESRSIYSNILVTVSQDYVYLTGSDMENTVRVKLMAKNASPGEVLVSGKKFAEIAKKMNSEDLIFELSLENKKIYESEESTDPETEGTLVKIWGSDRKSARYEITTSISEGFPSITLYNQQFLTPIPAAMLRGMMLKTMHSISQEDNRYIFNGLCFIFEGDELTLVGTDGRRLSAIKRKLPDPVRFSHDGDIVVHQRALREILRLLEEDENAFLAVEQREFYLSCGKAEMKSRLLEGRFPDYKKVIPAQSAIEFPMAREELLNALGQVMVMAQLPSYGVHLALKEQKMLLTCKNSEGGNAQIDLDIPYSGADLEVGLNGQFLQDVLRSLNCFEVILGFSDSSKPVVIKDSEDPDFISLIMPLRM